MNEKSTVAMLCLFVNCYNALSLAQSEALKQQSNESKPSPTQTSGSEYLNSRTRIGRKVLKQYQILTKNARTTFFKQWNREKTDL